MIDITKPVRTKDGQRVEIFSDKGREPYPLIGYIGDSTALGTWTKDGMFFEQESSHHDIENYKSELQPDADGWIPHTPGDPMPCDGDLVVDVRFRCGEEGSTRASNWIWQGGDDHEIIAWRPRKPQPEPEEWAAEKAAFAAGKKIQYRSDNDPIWTDTKTPIWFSKAGNNFNPQYRIKPEPQWVPMEPDDIVVGMEFRLMRGGARRRWVRVKPHMVWFDDIAQSFEDLMRKGWQYRINGGEWKPCKKEVQV